MSPFNNPHYPHVTSATKPIARKPPPYSSYVGGILGGHQKGVGDIPTDLNKITFTPQPVTINAIHSARDPIALLESINASAVELGKVYLSLLRKRSNLRIEYKGAPSFSLILHRYQINAPIITNPSKANTENETPSSKKTWRPIRMKISGCKAPLLS